MDFKKSFKDVAVLLCICAFFAVVLAATNSVTAPIIADRLAGAANQAYEAVIPGAAGFEDVDLSAYTLPSSVREAKRETSGKGYAFKIETKGYGSGLVLIIGVSPDGLITGATCIESNETNNVEKTYGENFIGKDKDGANSVDIVAGSTMTSNAYRGAIIDAINSVAIFGGATVETRTEEEIFQHNLKEALGLARDAEESFTKLFVTEYLNEACRLYKAESGKGYVRIIGEGEDAIFVGIAADGSAIAVVDALTNPVTEETEALFTDAKAFLELVNASTSEDVDIEAYKNSEDRNVVRAFRSINGVKKTATGNYIVELKATGYSTSDPIIILVSATADGVIIDVTVVSNNETPAIGGVQLEDGAFVDNFIGQDKEGTDAVNTVSGATVTTSAVKKAIGYVFTAVITIEGGAQ